MLVHLEDKAKAMYQPEEIFTLAWTKKEHLVLHWTICACYELRLPKVHLTYRIFDGDDGLKKYLQEIDSLTLLGQLLLMLPVGA